MGYLHHSVYLQYFEWGVELSGPGFSYATWSGGDVLRRLRSTSGTRHRPWYDEELTLVTRSRSRRTSATTTLT